MKNGGFWKDWNAQCVTHQHIYFCFCMLHTYDKQYSVTRSSRYGILENFIIHYYKLLFDVLFRTSAFVCSFPCVCSSTNEGSSPMKNQRGTNDTRCVWNGCSTGKGSGVAFFSLWVRSGENAIARQRFLRAEGNTCEKEFMLGRRQWNWTSATRLKVADSFRLVRLYNK